MHVFINPLVAWIWIGGGDRGAGRHLRRVAGSTQARGPCSRDVGPGAAAGRGHGPGNGRGGHVTGRAAALAAGAGPGAAAGLAAGRQPLALGAGCRRPGARLQPRLDRRRRRSPPPAWPGGPYLRRTSGRAGAALVRGRAAGPAGGAAAVRRPADVVGVLYRDTADAAPASSWRTYGDGGWTQLPTPASGSRARWGVLGPPESYLVDAGGTVVRPQDRAPHLEPARRRSWASCRDRTREVASLPARRAGRLLVLAGACWPRWRSAPRPRADRRRARAGAGRRAALPGLPVAVGGRVTDRRPRPAIRAEIESQVAAGQAATTRSARYFVDSYGEWILLAPPDPLVWWLPVVASRWRGAAGAGGLVPRRSQRAPTRRRPPLSEVVVRGGASTNPRGAGGARWLSCCCCSSSWRPSGLLIAWPLLDREPPQLAHGADPRCARRGWCATGWRWRRCGTSRPIGAPGRWTTPRIAAQRSEAEAMRPHRRWSTATGPRRGSGRHAPSAGCAARR